MPRECPDRHAVWLIIASYLVVAFLLGILSRGPFFLDPHAGPLMIYLNAPGVRASLGQHMFLFACMFFCLAGVVTTIRGVPSWLFMRFVILCVCWAVWLFLELIGAGIPV